LAEGVRSITGDVSASMPTTVPAFTDAAAVNQAIAVRQLA
jgi:hypothetical protein